MTSNVDLNLLLEENQGAPCQGQGNSDRAPKGWVRTYQGPMVTVQRGRSVPHPLQPPAGASGARSAGNCPCGCWTWHVGTPRITHPVYPPGYTHPGTRLGPHTDDLSSCMHHTTVRGTTGACTYGRFWSTVGEPRGIEYRRVSGSPYWFIDLRLVYTAV